VYRTDPVLASLQIAGEVGLLTPTPEPPTVGWGADQMASRTNRSGKIRTLAELLPAARAGDRDAEDELFCRLEARITALAKRKVWDEEAARDLAQETLQTVFLKYRQADFHNGFLPWVFTILHNKIGNYLKKRRREIERGALGGSPLDWPTIGVAIEPEVGTIDLLASVEKALARLSHDCRKIFRLLLAGAERPEIQEAFPGEPVGTTDSRVSRCRQMLLREMEEHGRKGGR